MDNLSFQRVPGQDLPENGSFAFVSHKEFINRISSFVLLDFGRNDSMCRFETSGKWKTRFSSWKWFWKLPKLPKWPFRRRRRHGKGPNPKPLSLELLCAYWKLQLGGKHVSPHENAFGAFQSCQNGRLGGAAVTAKVRTLNPLSLEFLCAYWKLQLGGKHVSPRENSSGSVQSCQKWPWEAQRSRQRFEP